MRLFLARIQRLHGLSQALARGAFALWMRYRALQRSSSAPGGCAFVSRCQADQSRARPATGQCQRTRERQTCRLLLWPFRGQGRRLRQAPRRDRGDRTTREDGSARRSRTRPLRSLRFAFAAPCPPKWYDNIYVHSIILTYRNNFCFLGLTSNGGVRQNPEGGIECIRNIWLPHVRSVLR